MSLSEYEDFVFAAGLLDQPDAGRRPGGSSASGSSGWPTGSTGKKDYHVVAANRHGCPHVGGGQALDQL